MSGDDDDIHGKTLVAPAPLAPVLPLSDSSPSLMAGTARGFVLAGRYEVVALLGVGGMGAVYRARDLELDEPVALKMLRRELVAVPGILERFRQEVKLARKVTSPHVARTFDIGDHEGEKFLTMELVNGGSLADEIARLGMLPIARVLEIATDACSGLAAAHAASVVHRDLKPENVLLGEDGSIKITDFGIATAQADIRLTQGTIGTPAYMAPEQVTGDPKIDARADIYAFGCMLYEMLAGDIPWKGESAFAVASARLLAAPPDIRALRPDVPPALAELVLTCMARDRDARPSDARELGAALARLAIAQSPPPLVASLAAPTPLAPHRARAASHVKTIAVLPIKNRGAPDDDYLADGLTDDLIDSLSMAHGLRVRSRGAVMRFKGEDRDPREIGRELDVHVFVDGSVRRHGDLLRVNVRLVSVDDAFQLWAKRVDRPASDLLALGEEVAQAVAGALDVDPAPKPEVIRDPAVVDLYLRARHAYFAFGVVGTELALALFDEALALAPEDPLILASAAMAHLGYTSMHPEAGLGFEKAVAIAERAVALAPGLAAGHIALASLRLHDGRDREAVREARLAIAAAPSNGEAHFLLGRFFAESGAKHEALAHLELALALDPRLNLAVAEVARIHALFGEWDLAEARLAVTHRDADDSPFLYWGNRMRYLMWEQNPAKIARGIAEARVSASAMPSVTRMVAVLEGAKGTSHEEDLDHWLTRSTTKRRGAFFNQLKAEVLGFKGQAEACMDAVIAADELGLTDLLWIDRCPVLDLVRADHRFVAARSHIAARAQVILAAMREGL